MTWFILKAIGLKRQQACFNQNQGYLSISQGGDLPLKRDIIRQLDPKTMVSPVLQIILSIGNQSKSSPGTGRCMYPRYLALVHGSQAEWIVVQNIVFRGERQRGELRDIAKPLRIEALFSESLAIVRNPIADETQRSPQFL